jgi:spore germination cell wall hydrolase CwlJ-like protein
MAKISYDSGATYSDDFSRPEYYDMNYRLPQLGLAGQIVQKMFPDPFSSGSYDNYMKQLVSNASAPAAPMQPYLAAARPVAEAAIAPIVAATLPASMMPANNFNLAQFNSAPNAQQAALAPPKMVQPEGMAHGGEVDAALHAVRHYADGGFLSDLFSGPDYLSTGKVASPTNWGDPESAADFFKADRALRLAREVQASEPARDMPLPLRRPVEEAAPRQQVAAPAPAPAPSPLFIPYPEPERAMEMPEVRIPYTMPALSVPHNYHVDEVPSHLAEEPGFGQAYNMDDANRLWADPSEEVSRNAYLKKYTLPAPQAEISRAVSLAQNLAPQQEAIPNAADALAAVEKLHNAGVYSGEALDKAGEILAAHNRAMFDNIPVDEALRLIRAEGPRMINQGMPSEERLPVQPLAYTAAPTPAPASAAIDQATGKMTARMPEEPHGTALTKQQADYVIRTIAAETSGKSPEETQAIASVILNRINSGKYGASPEAVLFAKRQFEPWMNPAGKNYPMKISPTSQRYSDARDALEAAMAGEDITRGATNFWGPKSQYALGRDTPDWAVKMPDYTDIGATRFHRPNKRAEGGEVEGYAGGGDVVAKALAALRGGNKVFPKPQRMFPEGARPPGGEYINAATGEAVTGQKPARAVLGVTPEGKPVFLTDPEQVDVTGSPGKGSTKTMTNLFRRSAGWDWKDAPEGYENVPMIVSTENRNKHYYSLGADYPKGVDLARYPKETSEPRLKPTTQGNVYPGEQVGTIVNKKTGDEHPVYDMVTIRNMLAGTGAGAAGAAAMPDDAAAEAPVDDALRVVREHHADGEAVGPVATDNRERVQAADRATDLAKQIQAYEASMARIREQPQDIQSMTHAPEKPRAPISVEALGKNREFGSAPYDVAGPLSSFAQGAYDMKTLPLYMYPPTAPLGMAIDTAEGVASGSPTQVAMGALGGPLKVARNVIAPLAVATGVTAPDEAEAGSLSKVLQAIRAYHGSPHKFDRFDLSKIGTGEGNQSYGHGLYFAENENVAKGYRDQLSGHHIGDVLIGEDKIPNWASRDVINAYRKMGYDNDTAVMAAHFLREHKGDINAASGATWSNPNIPDTVAEALLRTEYATPKGHIYEVGIHADPERLLNWDKPFREQSSPVQEAVRYAFGPQPLDARIGSNTMDRPGPIHSRLLNEAGVPGIKYLDAGSRGITGAPTHNYVIFDDKLIDINRRYAQGGEVEAQQDPMGSITVPAAGAPSDEPGLVDRAMRFVSQFNPVGSAEAADLSKLKAFMPSFAPTGKAVTRTGADILAKDPYLAANIPTLSGVKGAIPFQDMSVGYEKIPGYLEPYKPLKMEDLEGSWAVPLLSDLSSSGVIVHEIGGKKIDPFFTEGGGDFARGPAGRGDNPAGWASMKNKAGTYMNALEKKIPEGDRAVGIQVTMAPEAADSADMFYQAMLRQMPHAKVTKSAIADVDAKMAKNFPGWPGVMNGKEAEEFMQSLDLTSRKKLAETLDLATHQKAGFPDVGQTRFAITEPRLFGNSGLRAGYSVSELDPRGGVLEKPSYPHSNYTGSMAAPKTGGYLGGLPSSVHAKDIWQDWWNNLNPNAHDPRQWSKAQWGMMTQFPVQKIDAEMVDRVMKQQEQHKRIFGWREGGEVNLEP